MHRDPGNGDSGGAGAGGYAGDAVEMSLLEGSGET